MYSIVCCLMLDVGYGVDDDAFGLSEIKSLCSFRMRIALEKVSHTAEEIKLIHYVQKISLPLSFSALHHFFARSFHLFDFLLITLDNWLPKWTALTPKKFSLNQHAPKKTASNFMQLRAKERNYPVVLSSCCCFLHSVDSFDYFLTKCYAILQKLNNRFRMERQS